MKNKKLWIIIGVVVIVLAIIGAVTNVNGNLTNADAGSTPTVQATQAPTATPTPSPTSKPLTVEQRAIQLAQANAPSASRQTAKMDSSGGLTVTEFRDVVSQTTVKTDCFNVLKALWQANLPGVKDIDLEVQATLTDANGNQSVGSVGDCSLSHSLNWSSLDFNSAWSQYDAQFVDPALN